MKHIWILSIPLLLLMQSIFYLQTLQEDREQGQTAVPDSLLNVSRVKQGPESIPNLVTFWDFQKKKNGAVNYKSRGAHGYVLKEMNGELKTEGEGVFGPTSLRINRGQWLMIPRKDCPALNIHGKQEVSVVAWIKRNGDNTWHYIAGMWNERDAQRQYALFTNAHKQTDYRTLDRTDARYQTHGYVSDSGGATTNRPYCFSYASGKEKLQKEKWYMIAFTYDQKQIKVYVDGQLDTNATYNPFLWDKPIFSGGDLGSDFTVAQRALPKWPGYPQVVNPTHGEGFDGVLGGLAVYNRALTATEMNGLYNATKK